MKKNAKPWLNAEVALSLRIEGCHSATRKAFEVSGDGLYTGRAAHGVLPRRFAPPLSEGGEPDAGQARFPWRPLPGRTLPQEG